AYDDVVAIAERMESQPRVISLDPGTVGEVLGTVRTIADATDRRDEGVALVHEAARRIDRVRLAVREAPRPRVAALEWLDPVFVAGHWTPQLIEYAGGEDVLGLAGEHSRTAGWDEVAAAEPGVVVGMPCRYGAARQLALLVSHLDPDRYRAVVVLPHDGPLVGELSATGAEVHVRPALAVLRRGLFTPSGLVRVLARAAADARALAGLARR